MKPQHEAGMNAPVERGTARASSDGAAGTLHAFSACGIELEYAIVDSRTLDVRPIADQALAALGAAAQPVAEVTRGACGWSNELALHVVELKNTDPTQPLAALGARFQHEVRAMNAVLARSGARLMPAGMHPWMDPAAQTRLWPHRNAAVYRAYDRIFGCRTHGYANLQSMHVNLPFADDAELARLHEAVRLVLPLLPALAASSPFVAGRAAPALDYRLYVYRDNAARVPQISGAVIPERCASRADYEAQILQPMYRAIAPYDPAGLLRHEWLNARGAIVRFDRNAIEIRLLDTQECPAMDIGIAALVTDLVQALYEARLGSSGLRLPAHRELVGLLWACARDAEDAVIASTGYLAALGVGRTGVSAGGLWSALAEHMARARAPRLALWQRPFEHIRSHGTLARRLRAAAGHVPTRAALRRTYHALAGALETGEPFIARRPSLRSAPSRG
jgi:gamma-glutamyl:cysteine ligase YbdK (ATP-grasp superfamily)